MESFGYLNLEIKVPTRLVISAGKAIIPVVY
jgi:hypothetical protein